MAFADFLDLRTAVLEQVGRTDIADVFPRITKLAETGFNNRLRLLPQISYSTLVFDKDVAPLPDDLQEIIGVYDGMGREYVAQPVQAVRPMVCYYTLTSDGVLVNGISGDLSIDYYGSIPTIADSVTASNWLLQRHPSLYLYACSYEAAKAVRDADMASEMLGLLNAAYRDAEIDDDRLRYSRASVRVQGVTP